jgi:membrane-bound ClpP family serine protease
MDWGSLGYAVVLLALGVGLLVAEFFIVSLGLLALGAIACGAGAIYYAFLANDAVGWLFVITVPLLGAAVVRYGIARVQQSHLVPQTEVTAEAGYHHVADRLGVAIGTQGVMVTAGYPTGRARFEGGECDVQGRNGALDADDVVSVVAIDGPTIFVETTSTAPPIADAE